jgi:hypothetical protein
VHHCAVLSIHLHHPLQVESVLQTPYAEHHSPLVKRMCEELKSDDAFFK